MALIMGGALLFTPPIYGDNRPLVEALVESGALTQEQAAEILDTERPAITPAGTNFRNFRIRGLIQTQFGYVRAKNNNTEDYEDWSTLEMRRVRLGVQGTLLQNVRAQFDANLVPGEAFSMRSAFLQWREHEPAYIKVGLDRPIFGFERNTSSAELLTVERSHITNTIINEEMIGVSLEGEHNALFYGAGIYTNRTNRNLDGISSRYLYNASIGVTLDDFMPEGHELALRADAIFNDDLAPGASFTFEQGYSLSAHHVWDRFDFRAEYLSAEDAAGNTTQGWYLMPSYMITPKVRAVVRFEQADSDHSRGIRATSRYTRRVPNIGGGGAQHGNDFQAIYVGANYYINGDYHKLMTGIEFSELATETAGDLRADTLYAAWRVRF